MDITLCVTVSNRLWQLKRTLKHNVKFTKVDTIELCIAAYNDKSVMEFLKVNYPAELNDGRIKVVEFNDTYKPKDGSNFACGHVKKYAHSMGTGKVVFNLDADNFVDEETIRILTGLKYNQIYIIDPAKMSDDGRSGRIGIHRSKYIDIGGYKDRGRLDDIDFVRRAVLSGCRTVYGDCIIPPIPNEINEDMSYD